MTVCRQVQITESTKQMHKCKCFHLGFGKHTDRKTTGKPLEYPDTYHHQRCLVVYCSATGNMGQKPGEYVLEVLM